MAVVLLGLIQPETPPASEPSHGEEATHAAEQLEAFEHNRFVVERAIDASMLLTSTQKGVLQAITRHLNQETGTAWPSYATIAHKAGYERSTAIDAIAELEQLGWVHKEVRRGDDGWHQSNLYRVRIPMFDAEAFAEAERVRGRRRERERPVAAVTTSPTPSRAESMKSAPKPAAKPLVTKPEVEPSKLNADQRAVLQALKSRDELRSVATPEQAIAIWQIATNFQKDRATTLSAVLDVANKTPAMGAQSPEKLLGRITSFVAAARPAATPSTGPDVMAEYRELLKREAEQEREFDRVRATASGPRRPLRVDWPPKPA